MLEMFICPLFDVPALLVKSDEIFVIHSCGRAVSCAGAVVDQVFDSGTEFINGNVEKKGGSSKAASVAFVVEDRTPEGWWRN